ncbi:MAG: SMP-30/gluconolactonase/LRE family protein, partial [Thermoleophilaceae bacterium]
DCAPAGMGHRGRLRFALAAWLALACALAAGPAAARERFDTRVLAHVPSPGYPALSLVAPDGTIYVGSFENPAGDSLPSKVFAFAPDGRLLRTYTVPGQDLAAAHGVQVAAIDSSGLLYLLDQTPARILTLDPRSGRFGYYGSFHDVPACMAAGATSDCSQTILDNPPEPDYAAWGTDGALYVTDYEEGLIWRVPPGGGNAAVWFTDPRIDGGLFGPAGLVLMPDKRTLMFSSGTGGPTSIGSDPTAGALFKLDIRPDGRPGTLTKIWDSAPREAPDGFALSAAGNVYLTLVGPAANQIVELSPQGRELARYPSPLQNATMTVPFDEPSSAVFDGQSLIVTNQSYFAGNRNHMTLLDVYVGESGMPAYQPRSAVSGQRSAVFQIDLLPSVQ